MARPALFARQATVGALGSAFGGPLRRAHLSFAAMWAGESAFMVSLAVVAFRDDGVTAVGLVTAARMATAAVLTPLLATVADRVRRERVLAAIGLVRAAMLGCAAAVTASGGATALTYVFAVVATVALALFRPAHSALLPALAHSPADLTSANAVRGTLDSAATLGGPALASALLAVSGPALVFGACAALSLLGGLVVVALPYDAPPRAESTVPTRGRDMLEGFATIARNPTLALITGLGVVQTFTRGCMTVLVVMIAIDLLHIGSPGVGILNAVVGAGGLVGSLCAFALVRRGGLGTWFGVGIALFGAPFAVLGAAPREAVAIVLLGIVGIGNSLIDVSAFTMLARMTDETVLARMFAGFEALLTLGVAAGGLLVPGIIELLGQRPALVAVGLLAPVAVSVCAVPLRRLDRAMRVRDVDTDVLRAVPMLRALPAATIEQLGAALVRTQYPAGAVVLQQGDSGDAFYVIESGRAEVVRDGEPVNILKPGDGFGEVALLADRPRTATVRVGPDAPLAVAVLGRGAFLTAVTGYPLSAVEGNEAVARIKARDAARAAHDPSVPEPPGY